METFLRERLEKTKSNPRWDGRTPNLKRHPFFPALLMGSNIRLCRWIQLPSETNLKLLETTLKGPSKESPLVLPISFLHIFSYFCLFCFLF